MCPGADCYGFMERTIYQFDDLSQMSGEARTVPARARHSFRHGPARRVGVIYNVRSHRNDGSDLASARREGVTVSQPKTRLDIAIALAEFAAADIDYLIISGGDGTVRDVLTMGQTVFGNHWPQIAVLPKGKTNALNVDLGAPEEWTLAQAIDAYESGRRLIRRPLAISREGSTDPAILGFILGAGAFTLGVEAGQDAHRIGFFNSLAVGMTSAWGVLQALFGSDRNRWRRGTEMAMTHAATGRAFPHSGHGDRARRHVMLASTLEKMPLGLKIFDRSQSGIRVAMLDKPRRRMLAVLPAILAGWRPHWLSAAGFHNLSSDAFSLELDEAFILDGEHFESGQYRVQQGPELTFVSV
ncbi:MAG: hypothetical protein DI637_10340 [Citromicrobium sp.]|nr:MAG: hypothetical protein DI637_10340 [Citromicrobium sp.]